MINVEKSIGKAPIKRTSHKEIISRRRKALVAAILTSIITISIIVISKTVDIVANIPEKIEVMAENHNFNQMISSQANEMLKDTSYVSGEIQGYNHSRLAQIVKDKGDIDLWLYGISKSLDYKDKDVKYNMDSLIFQLSLIDEYFKNNNITDFEKYVNSLGYNSIDEYNDNQINVLSQQYDVILTQKGVSK